MFYGASTIRLCWPHNHLTAVIPSVVTAQIGVTEGVLIRAKGTKLRIVAWSAMVGPGTAWAIRNALFHVTGAVHPAGVEAIVIGQL